MYVVGIGDGEEAEVLPLVDGEFVEKRDGAAGLDRVQESLVCGVEFLVAAPAGTGVVDDVGRLAVKVGIAGIDAAEVGEERDQAAAALVDTVADLMQRSDARPGEYVADPDLIEKGHRDYCGELFAAVPTSP